MKMPDSVIDKPNQMGPYQKDGRVFCQVLEIINMENEEFGCQFEDAREDLEEV